MPATLTDLRYLKAAWYLQREDTFLTVGAVAERLRVSHPSASSALKRLTGQGYLQRSHGRALSLTPAGEHRALLLVRRHRLLETFLADVLGVPWDEVHEEAETIEWHISERLEQRIADAVGTTQRDPHGDPIPPIDGEHRENVDVPLKDVPLGATVTISRVSDDDPALLRLFAQQGLTLGTRATIVRMDPPDGPLWVRNDAGEHALGPTAVLSISVAREVGAPPLETEDA